MVARQSAFDYRHAGDGFAIHLRGAPGTARAQAGVTTRTGGIPGDRPHRATDARLRGQITPWCPLASSSSLLPAAFSISGLPLDAIVSGLHRLVSSSG